MQVQPNYMRKRKAVGGNTTPNQQWVNRPGQPHFDLSKEIPIVYNEQEIVKKIEKSNSEE